MRNLHVVRGPLCRGFLARPPSHIIRRHKFSGRPAAVDTPRTTLLPTTPARTRFAPSPTGYLHIGSLRTALYNYLLAKATGGQFLLRLEDTDQSRIVPDAERRLYADLKWAGVGWDEGPDVGGPYGPYKQSERLGVYNQHAEQLLKDGRAYRCFCTPADLDRMKALNIQHGESAAYNGTCSHIAPDVSARRAANGEEHCVRFKSGGNHPFVIDLVYGSYRKPGKEDDFIIIKRDGYPTYHFANVIDDHLMDITHVIRGAEWLVSTPRHVALYDAFGWRSPVFAHVGLLVDHNKHKLSKRHGDIDITSWRDRGILPIALLNYVLLLGWSHGRSEKGQSEVMDLDEMIKKFHLKFTKGDITVNNKDAFIQKSHMRRLMQRLDPDDFLDVLVPGLEAGIKSYGDQQQAHARGQIVPSQAASTTGPLVLPARPRPDEDGEDAVVSKAYVKRLLGLDVKSYKSPQAYLQRNLYLVWQIPDSVYVETLGKELEGDHELFVREENLGESGKDNNEGTTIDSVRPVSALTATLRELLQGIAEEDWKTERIEETIMPYLKTVFSDPKESSHQIWGYHLLRWVINAMQPGPALLPCMEFLGREETLRRVDQAYKMAKGMEEGSRPGYEE